MFGDLLFRQVPLSRPRSRDGANVLRARPAASEVLAVLHHEEHGVGLHLLRVHQLHIRAEIVGHKKPLRIDPRRFLDEGLVLLRVKLDDGRFGLLNRQKSYRKRVCRGKRDQSLGLPVFKPFFDPVFAELQFFRRRRERIFSAHGAGKPVQVDLDVRRVGVGKILPDEDLVQGKVGPAQKITAQFDKSHNFL